VGAVASVALVREQLDLQTRGTAGIVESSSKEESGDTAASIGVFDDHGFKEGGGLAVVCEVRHYLHRGGADGLATNVGYIHGEARACQHPAPHLQLAIRWAPRWTHGDVRRLRLILCEYLQQSMQVRGGRPSHAAAEIPVDHLNTIAAPYCSSVCGSGGKMQTHPSVQLTHQSAIYRIEGQGRPTSLGIAPDRFTSLASQLGVGLPKATTLDALIAGNERPGCVANSGDVALVHDHLG
jgi:hypothetical protein